MPTGKALIIPEFAEVGRHLPGEGGMLIDMRLQAQSVQDDDHDMNCKACSYIYYIDIPIAIINYKY